MHIDKKIITGAIHTNITIPQRQYKHSMRNKNKLCVPKPRTVNYGKKNLTYEGVILYNKLPEEIKNSKTLQT